MKTKEILKLYDAYVADPDHKEMKEVQEKVDSFFKHKSDPDVDEYAMAMADAYGRNGFLEGFSLATKLICEGLGYNE